jgi:stage II sporulation protein D
MLIVTLATVCLGLPPALIGPAAVAEAAVTAPKLDSIRVALYIDTGKYSANTPAVTLSSDKGLDIGLRGATGTKPAYAAADKQIVKASLDGYRVLLWESGDASQAKALAQKLDDASTDAALVQTTRQGKAGYQVSVGPYVTKEAAAAALSKLAALPNVGSGIKGYASAVTGPLHWNAGAYATEAEAQAQAAAIEQAGFDADVAALDAAADAPAYAVLVASASDAAELNAAKQQLTAVLPGISLQPVDPALAYVLQRTELAYATDGAAAAAGDGSIQSLAIGGSSAKLLVAPKPSGTVKVVERSDRTYRGALELSGLNGKLAVINELPFEQYLVSVVSSELGKDWPAEALKAQAVAARTYALKQGLKYQIAHVADATIDQVYKGAGAENASAAAAVAATQGEVLTDKAGLISPLFYSNAGGMTADPAEVWGNKVGYLKSTASPDDGAEKGKTVWYGIALPNGNVGYIHSSYAKDTGEKNKAGLPYYESTATGVAVRSAPFVDNTTNPALFKVDIGDRFVVFDQAVESNAYSWFRGPFEADKLKDKINSVLPHPLSGGLARLEVSARGPSGRVTEVKANGQALQPEYPDALRTILNGLPSTRFEIEETGSYTILGANGAARSMTPAMTGVLIADGSGQVMPLASQQLFVLNADNKVKMKDKTTRFIFKGTGFGHGLGMSQWGAKGYAELGYDYKKILQTYYDGVSIIKE